MNTFKQGRLGEEIRKLISSMLITDIKDNRLQDAMITISQVDVTRDGSYATCYFTILNDKGEDESVEREVLAGLNSAKGLMKKHIGQSIKLRRVPELIFKRDKSLEYGRHIEEILKTIE